MPDYFVHAGGVKAIAVAVAAVGALQLVGVDKTWTDTLAIAGGALVGLVLEPDLDIDNGLLLFHEMERGKAVSWVLGHFFQAYWWPYAVTIHHRSLVSHAPIFSTLLRILYLVPLAIAVALLLKNVISPMLHIEVWPLIAANKSFLLWFGVRALIGLMLADICHFSLDFSHGQYGKDNRHV